jgi:hypothetical protein
MALEKSDLERIREEVLAWIRRDSSFRKAIADAVKEEARLGEKRGPMR